MLVSMTGFGEARTQSEKWSVTIELRAVNNRHFKLSARISDPFSALESDFERLIRETVRRGTVQLSVRIERPSRPEDYKLNLVALASFRDQLRVFSGDPDRVIDPSLLINLPGVVQDANTRGAANDPRDDWPELAEIARKALTKFQESRIREGRAMAEELNRLAESAIARLTAVEQRTPQVASSYRDRLHERIQNLIQGLGVSLEPKDLIREVAIFADRGDISEEIARLRAHLQEFEQSLKRPDISGRHLEFLLQEMGREANTMGSKANDVEISRHVVEIKGLLESIRELILNVE